MLTPLPHSGILDFTNPAAYAWWRDAHKKLFDDGVDVIKSDFGEQVPDDAVAANGDCGRRLHNVYPLLYNRCVFEATERFGRKERRAADGVEPRGWAGSQRTPMGWGGDPQSDWEGLAASIRGGLSWGMSGNPYHSSDIGGFYGAAQPSAELYVRWLQATVFGSHIRVHGIGEREPWAFGAEAEAVAQEVARVPLPADSLSRARDRAGDADGPAGDARDAARVPGQCAGARLRDAVHVRRRAARRADRRAGGEVEIALPPGGWYDLNTRRRFAGRQVLRYRAKLDQFPVFGREGYALPLGRAVQHTGEIDAATPLELLWVFGQPEHALDGFAQATIETARRGALRRPGRAGRQGRRVRRCSRRPSRRR